MKTIIAIGRSPKFWAFITGLNLVTWVKAYSMDDMVFAWIAVLCVAGSLFFWWAANEMANGKS